MLDTAQAGGLVIRGGALRVLGYGVGVGLSVVAAALLIRSLGAADFGRYTAVVSVVTLVSGLIEAGMTSIGVREFTVQDPQRREQLLRSLLGLRVALGFVGCGAAVLFAVLAGYDDTMVVGAALASAGLLVALAQVTYTIPLQAGLRLGWVTALDVLRQALTLVFIVVLVVVGAELLPFFSVPILVGVLLLAATAPLVRGSTPFKPGLDLQEWRRLLRLTLPFAVANAVGIIYAYLAVVILSVISSNEEVGYFGAAFRVFIVIAGVAATIVAAAFPVLTRAARDDQVRLAYALQRLWEMCLLLGAGFALVTALGADFIVQVIAGSGFDRSVDVLTVLAFALLASYMFASWGFALLSLARYRALMIANAVALTVSAVLTLVLAPDHGALGAGIAVLAGETTLATGYAVGLMRSRPDLRPKLEIVPKVALAFGLGFVPLLLPVPGVVRAALAGAIYTTGLILLRAIPDEVHVALRSRD